MRKILVTTGITGLLFLMNMTILFAQGNKEIHKTFEAKKSVQIKTVSGDCNIKEGNTDQILVDLVYDTEPADAFEPDFQERNNGLKLKERWYGSSSGNVTWTLTVPPKTEIDFSTASGDLSVYAIDLQIEASTASGDVSIEDSEGEFDVSTASGDIDLTDLNGEFEISTASGDIEASNIAGGIEFNTASGDIKVRDSKGTFELSCASGDIKGSGIIIEEESSFSAASGDVEVELGERTSYDLCISTASGDATVDFGGNTISGYFEFTTSKRRGKIRSPIEFDKEEEFEKNGKIYERKIFSRGNGKPRIHVSSFSGTVELKE